MYDPRTSRRAGLLAALLWLAVAAPALGASLDVVVDRDVASRGDQVMMTVTVSGENRDLPSPQLPAIPGVVVSRGGTSQNFQMVNGAVSTSVAWTYYLRIETDEDVTIPVLEVSLDGRTLRSRALTIRIAAKAAPPPAAAGAAGNDAAAPAGDRGDGPGPGDDHFVTMTVDRETAYVGEQVVLVFRYHANPYARGLDRPQYSAPRVEGFWREDLPPNRNYREVVGGQQYDITEIRYALFPTRPGVLTIEPAVVTLPTDPFADFFSVRRRSRRAGPVRLATDALQIHVRDLPHPAPEGFAGIVSRQVDLTVRVDRDTVPRGEPVSLSLSLGADGSLKSVDELPWTAPEGLQVHEAGGGLETKKDHGRLFSRLAQERVLIPLAEGELALPPVTVVYFDPAAGHYSEVSREIGMLTVLPGDRPVAGDTPAQMMRTEIERLASDLRFAHPAPRRLRAQGAPLPARAVWWVGLLAPLVLLVLLRWQLSREASRLRDPLGTRRRGALRQARSLLAEAGRAGDDLTDGALVIKAVQGYVADKTGRAAAGLQMEQIRAHARDLGRDRTAERLVELVRRCEAARYGAADATGSLDAGEMAREALSLLTDLDSAGGKRCPGVLRAVLPWLLALAVFDGAPAAAQDASGSSGGDPVRLMAEGVRAYTDGELDTALDRFRSAAATSRDPDLYYNLGNTHARRGELGRAVLNYLRAQRLRPRDADLRANLGWVRSHTVDVELAAAPLPPVLKQVRDGLTALSLDEWCLLLIASVWLACLVVAWSWWRTGWSASMRRLGLSAGVLVLFVLAITAWRWHEERMRDTAVVIVSEVSVHSGPDATFPVLFQVHDGLTLQVRALREDWSQVTLGGEWNGWVPSATLAHVRVESERDE